MKAIILCAGRGKRLSPLTDTMPKGMIKVNSIPLLIRNINLLIRRGFNINDIIVIIGYMEGIIRQYCALMIAKGAVFITQFRPDGTANAINLAKEYIDRDFIVLSSDVIYEDDDIQKLMQIPNSLLYTKQKDRLEEYGTLDISGMRIVKINEKVTKPVSCFVNCGAYHFTPDIFDYIPKTEIDKRFNERIITNTINLMIQDKIGFIGIKIDELNEITYPEDIEIVEKRLKEKGIE